MSVSPKYQNQRTQHGFRQSKANISNSLSKWIVGGLSVIVFILYYAFNHHFLRIDKSLPSASSLQSFQDCSIRNLQSTGLYFLSTAVPVTLRDFEERRDHLAQALVTDGVDAIAMEPGYMFKYYANVSQPEWEVWEPEERPFLMIVQPDHLHSERVKAKVSFLCPSFESERARLLGMSFSGSINIISWEEHWDPYATLRNSSIFATTCSAPRVMVDGEMRDFIQRGLQGAGFEITGLGENAEMVRQIKSEKEIGILRAVNTGTVEAVRQMRKCLYSGLTENAVTEVLDNTLRAAGLDPFFDIVLFDENASNPHGGTNGSKVLEAKTFVLIDVGAHLLGYSSDICRTFLPPFLRRPDESEAIPLDIQEKLKVWNVVFESQTQSSTRFHTNATAASVDIAARKIITDEGYGEAFTHRVGHGIGIKAHESPYLHKGNHDTLLKAGMTFTSEPGVYLVNKFGVRHEDVYLVQEGGPEVLSGRRAGGPWDP